MYIVSQLLVNKTKIEISKKFIKTKIYHSYAKTKNYKYIQYLYLKHYFCTCVNYWFRSAMMKILCC